jgi:hypothetical protein
MNYEKLKYTANTEIDWLVYYSTRDSRRDLNIDSNLYNDLVSIGYAKRRVPLVNRCAMGILTSDTPITKGSNLEDINECYTRRDVDNNKYISLEVYLILYPERKQEVINELKRNL